MFICGGAFCGIERIISCARPFDLDRLCGPGTGAEGPPHREFRHVEPEDSEGRQDSGVRRPPAVVATLEDLDEAS